MKKGIDISTYQGSVDFNKVKEDGIEFVIFREGYRNSTDPRFFEYVQKAKAAGLLILAIYHFSYALNEGESVKEAQFTVENMRKAGLGPEVIIFFDFEYDTVTQALKKGVKLTRTECNAHTVAFCEEVKRLGYVPGVYTNLDYHKNWYTKDVLSRYHVWLADYSGGPDFDCLVQQYSSTGQVAGIKGNVDVDYYYGDDLKIKNDQVTTPAIESVKKDNETLAREVIDGKWGIGSARKLALEAAGYSYKEVQDLVNHIVNGSAVTPKDPVQDQSQPASKDVVATVPARKFERSLSGTYVTTADLYCRNDAGTNKVALCKIPKGTKVSCYGYYSLFNYTKWLYITFVMDSVRYTGFSSSAYLKK